MTLVDANILIDLFTDDPVWADRSGKAFIEEAERGVVGINPLIYAEVSVAFSSDKKLDALLEGLELVRWDLPYTAAFAAGKAFRRHKRSGGEKRSPLPDFYIGAHADYLGCALLTRDLRRYRTYFPNVRLIEP